MSANSLSPAEKAYRNAETSYRIILENYRQAYEQYTGLGQLDGYDNPKTVEAQKRCLEIYQGLMIAVAEQTRTKNEWAAVLFK
jgi:hypothetical protein